MTATYIHSGPQKVIWRDVIEFASTEKCRCQEWRGGYGYGGTLKSVPTAVAIPIANVPQRVKICKLPARPGGPSDAIPRCILQIGSIVAD